jgi:hypothetical protein
MNMAAKLKIANPEDGRQELCDGGFGGFLFPVYIEVEHRTTGHRSYVGQIKSDKPKEESRVGFIRKPSRAAVTCRNPEETESILEILSIAYGRSFAFYPISTACFAG